jgi:hypothetical protein
MDGRTLMRQGDNAEKDVGGGGAGGRLGVWMG